MGSWPIILSILLVGYILGRCGVARLRSLEDSAVTLKSADRYFSQPTGSGASRVLSGDWRGSSHIGGRKC
jgi:hypothetical protein